MLRLTEPGELSLWDTLEHAIARGEIVDGESYRARRVEVLKERREAIADAQSSLVSVIELVGGKVTALCSNMYCLDAALPAAAVVAIAARDDVARLDLATADVLDAVTGVEVRAGSQLTQFTAAGYDGENGAAEDIRFGIIDNCGTHDEHKGFRDSTNPTSFRYLGRFNCTTAACAGTTDYINQDTCDVAGSPTAALQHMTVVAGTLFGDLTDGQDASVQVSSQCIARSGYSGEALGRIYAAPGATNTRKAYDAIVGVGPSIPVANESKGSATDDPQCLGESARNRDANDLYEAGILLFKSAGNAGNSSSSDCTVSSPGAAMGVFTVGNHQTGTTGEANVRGDSIAPTSSRGGTSAAEGKSRSIVDITAFGQRDLLFDTSGAYTNSASGTSISTPIVSAAAINFIDHYHSAFGSSIDANPGRLHVNMLLMGDRQGEAGKLTGGFSNVFGAGRLKARKFDLAGMDAPAQWATGQVCVGEGDVIPVPVNGGSALPSTVDTFGVTFWWYDRRHELGTTIDDVNIQVIDPDGSIVIATFNSFEEKKRIHRSGAVVAGHDLVINVIGTQITADLEGCGTNKMKVYWAYYFEDSARDDADGPGSEIEPE